MDYSYVTERTNEVRSQVARSAAKSNRSAADVRLIAVTKSVPAAALPAIHQAGLLDVAENRWQVARDKLAHPLASLFCWHFIGTLQLNKVKYIVPNFTWVHSVDNEELLQALATSATRLGRTVNVLLQVNVAEEPQKHGFRTETVASVVKAAVSLSGLQLRGLMTMAPAQGESVDERTVRHVFATLRELQREVKQSLSLEHFDELSMGMSNDYPLAIEEGSTFIRVGQALVGTPPER